MGGDFQLPSCVIEAVAASGVICTIDAMGADDYGDWARVLFCQRCGGWVYCCIRSSQSWDIMVEL